MCRFGPFFLSDLGKCVETVLRSSRELHWTFEQSTLGDAGVGYPGIGARLELSFSTFLSDLDGAKRTANVLVSVC